MEYLLVTNVWNEANNIEKFVKMVSKFSLLPKLWLWINDGSTDTTEIEIERARRGYASHIPMMVVNLPKKEIGSLATIGQAYNYAFERTKIPMGGSKCIRWDIIKRIDNFWDPAPDTFLNIKAKAMGYDIQVYRHETFGFIGGPTSNRNLTWNGAYYAGALWAYVHGTKFGAFQRMIYRIIKKRNGKAFWKGYKENRIWRCNDDDIRRYFESKIKSYYDRIKCSGISILGAGNKKICKLFNRHRL